MPFLYNDPGYFDPAYFIIPQGHPFFAALGEDGEPIEPQRIAHQYGCLMCQRFEIMGRVERIPYLTLTQQLHRVLGCDATEHDLSLVSALLNLEVEEIMGEGLLKLKDGRYIATENCD